MKRKVVFLADCLVTQKAGIHFYARQFIKRAITQYPDNQYYTVLPYPYEQLDIEEILVPIKKWIPGHFRMRSFNEIPKVLKKLSPDLVIEMAHFGPFNLPKSIKKATVIHDLTPINFPQWHDKSSHYSHKFLLPKILKNSNQLLVNSVQTKQDLIDYYPACKDKTTVCYPYLMDDPQGSAEDLTGLLAEANYLLSVGTIEPRKNYVTLLKAFDKLASKFSKLQLRLVGYKGWKSKNVFDLIERSSYKDRIILEGYTTDNRLRSLYAHAKAFVFPSLYEGFGLPLLEALSYSVPIVCSDIPTSREICGNSATYFAATDDRALVEKTLQLLNDEDFHTAQSNKSQVRFLEFNQAKLPLDSLLG